MSACSSSGSWSGDGGVPPDIIDLDKFMRGAVRPPRPDSHTMRCDQLVVDAGGVDRKPGSVALPAPSMPSAGPTLPVLTAPSSSSGSRPPPHAKRFSHDSGLSDGSYARRKHRPHRRATTGDNNGVRAPRTPTGSSNSLRAFRAVCERALLDQQAQIARVAELCERLTERPPPRRRSERSATPDTSDVSSSSRSTRDLRRKDKHRTEECKTYKIIMNKLDELNRLFAARARSPPPAAPRRASPSSGSVSVSDKLVATEPEHRAPLQVNHNTVTVVRGGSTCGACGVGGASAAGGGSLRLSALRAVANTCALDIAPHDALPRHNIATESVVQCDSGTATGSSAGDPRCGFDLEDPVHLYSQAKRLQALPATTRRARSVEPTARRYCERDRRDEFLERRSPRSYERPSRMRGEQPRDHSLCALCRGYWRALTHYLAAQIFCYPDTACN